MLQTCRRKSSASECLPKRLAVGREISLARRGDGYQHDRVLQQLPLWYKSGSDLPKTDVCSWTYKLDGIQLGDLSIETKALSDPAQLLGNVLGVACLGAIEDKGSPRLRSGRHGAILRLTPGAFFHQCRQEYGYRLRGPRLLGFFTAGGARWRGRSPCQSEAAAAWRCTVEAVGWRPGARCGACGVAWRKKNGADIALCNPLARCNLRHGSEIWSRSKGAM
jgi:hypothetical protein